MAASTHIRKIAADQVARRLPSPQCSRDGRLRFGRPAGHSFDRTGGVSAIEKKEPAPPRPPSTTLKVPAAMSLSTVSSALCELSRVRGHRERRCSGSMGIRTLARSAPNAVTPRRETTPWRIRHEIRSAESKTYRKGLARQGLQNLPPRMSICVSSNASCITTTAPTPCRQEQPRLRNGSGAP